MAKIILITGGCRSGKSLFATRLASDLEHNVIYIATGQGLDDEMRQRIKVHKARRSDRWRTIEAPTDVAQVITGLKQDGPLILIDCLTMMVSNLILGQRQKRGNRGPEKVEREVLKKVASMLKALKKRKSYAIIVTNEVGSGVVPDNRLARDFRDLAGRINQVVAKEADEVYLMVSGIPFRIK